MSYDYRTERPRLFTEEGVEMLTAIRDDARRLLKLAGAVRLQEVIAGPAAPTGDTWTMLACFDYLVERGELREITGPDVPGQHRIFVAGRE